MLGKMLTRFSAQRELRPPKIQQIISGPPSQSKMNTRKIRVLLAVILFFAVSDVGAMERGIRPSAPADQPRAEIISEYVICKQPRRYIGWPSVALAGNGDVLIAFSGDRDWHVCPWGKIYVVRKPAGQDHFGEPKLVVNTPLDDRDVSLVVLKDGTVLLSFTTSLAFDNAKIERYKQYRKHAAKLSKDIRKKWKGTWLSKSTDNGKTWGPYISSPVHTPHGPTVLSDGRLLYVRPSVYESRDQGDTWKKIARIERDPKNTITLLRII